MPLGFNAAKRCCTNCLRLSLRTIHQSSRPDAIGRRRRRYLISACRDPNRFDHLSFEAVVRRTHSEVGSQPTRFIDALDEAASLALVVQGEDVASADDLAFHSTDLADALDPPDAIAHPLNMHEDIDRTGDLGA